MAAAEPVHDQPVMVPNADGGAPTTMVVDDVHVTYRIYADSRPTLRKLVTNRFNPRPFREVKAVEGVSFSSSAGECIGVIGRNGSGKSTLLRAMTGLQTPTAGAAFASATPVLLGVGAALQDMLPGRENIFLGCTALGMTRREVEEIYDDIVGFSGLEEFIDLPMRAYSSGMAARLAFAIATAVTPEILLIDEALAVGDAEFRHKSEARIRELLGKAGTIFIVSHSLGFIEANCTRAIWLDRGKVMLDGDADEVVAAYREATGDVAPEAPDARGSSE